MSKALRKSYLGLILVLGFCGPVEAQVQESEKSLKHSPQKGFSSAERSLTLTFLKLAGSLEHHGSPENYIRWILKENSRIDAKYQKVFGGNSTSRPAYLTDQYVEDLLTEWKKLEKPLKLDLLCKDSGKNLRHAIRGSWHKSPQELAEEELQLSAEEQGRFRKFLEKPFFSKADLETLDAFYAHGATHDRLSEEGKKQLSQRIYLGTMTPKARAELAADAKKKYAGGTIVVDIFNEYQELLLADMEKPGKRKIGFNMLQTMLEDRLRLGEVVDDFEKAKWNERDAVWHSHIIRELFKSRFRIFEGKISPKGEKATKANLTLMAENLLVFAHLEFMVGLAEKMADDEVGSR